MANREWWHGRDGREMDERELQERSNYYGQGGWRGDEDRGWRGDEERWMGRDRGYFRDDRWRRDMGRDFSRHEWSPYDRGMRDEYRRDTGFGYGGTDRYFGGGGYGGYGDRGMGYRERSMDRREGGFFGPGSGMFERDRGMMERDRGMMERDRGMMERDRGMMERRMGRGPRGYQRSDERIKEDICDRLMHSWINAEDVEIDVKNGEVTLSGTVEHRLDKRAIEDMADDVLGVKDVQNRIRCGQHHPQQQSTQPPSRKPTA